MKVKIKLLNKHSKVPRKAHKSDACYDVYATSKEDLGDGRVVYGLGIALQPCGSGSRSKDIVQFDLRARSSIHKTGMILSNCIGTGDSSYTGEYKAVFYKVIKSLPDYEVGDRILQLQVNSTQDIEFIECVEFASTERGDGGFGSTGR